VFVDEIGNLIYGPYIGRNGIQMDSPSLPDHDHNHTPPLWLVIIATAAAGGLGWGIRGQYGHETGAMLAGVLVALTLVHLFCPRAKSLTAARAVALCALGISLGGSETYGQTVGLTHDAELVGNWAALRWGLLGLALKGGLWISFGGAMLGMGLGNRTYRIAEIIGLLIAMMLAIFLGNYLLNTPFDPASRQLPRFYFSDAWYWEPNADLEPRREQWGGLLAALIVLVAYVGAVRKDWLAVRLAAWGFLGGALGFPGGQCLQAYHAWNVESFRDGWFATLEPHMNWWNFMETTFGAVFGAVLALGLWLNRKLIAAEETEPARVLSLPVEWILVAIHVPILTAWNFISLAPLDAVADHALPMIAIPLVGVIGGRIWPYLLSLPIVALPIAGKTLRQLSYYEPTIPPLAGWFVYVVVPLLVVTAAALVLARQWNRRPSALVFSRWALLLTTWLYFGLNYAFFQFPWPWQPWTGRTPNAIVFAVCTVILTLVALFANAKLNAASHSESGARHNE
jgi:hypothetical protein